MSKAGRDFVISRFEEIEILPWVDSSFGFLNYGICLFFIMVYSFFEVSFNFEAVFLFFRMT